VYPYKLDSLIYELNKGPVKYPSKILYNGFLLSGKNITEGGFDHGEILFLGTKIEKDTTSENSKDDTEITIIFQNENLILWDTNLTEPVIMAPDLISYLILSRKNGKKDSQLVYSNGDIIDPSTNKLKEEFKDAEVCIIGLQASDELKKINKKVELLHDEILNNIDMDEIDLNLDEDYILPENYHKTINKLGYYGKYLPFNPI